MYLVTMAGAFAFDLFPNGQTPRVQHGPSARLPALPRQEVGLAARRLVWPGRIAALNAGQDAPLVHERSGS